MTLRRRNSRCIEVDAVRFRYIISKSRIERDMHFSLNLTIQLEGDTGRLLQIKGLRSRDFWLDFPQNASAEKYVMLKPKHVAEIIRCARALGWNPHQPGSPFCFEAAECLEALAAI